MKPTMLVTGSTKGLGKSLREHFEEDYQVLGVARSHADICGDLKDANFRARLVREVHPQVVINNAGISGQMQHRLDTYIVNYIAAVDLTLGFAKKMTSGHIFNISSVSAGCGLLADIGESDLDYILSKKALSDFTQLIQFRQMSPVKICSIEPGFMMTDLYQIQERYLKQDPRDLLTRKKIKPFDPSYIANVVRWLLNQPQDVAISSIRIMNQSQHT